MYTDKKLTTGPGSPVPFGATVKEGGTQFSLFSRHAEVITLLLFENESRESPFIEVHLDPAVNRTGDIWHIWVEGIGHGQIYAFRADGPYVPAEGHRYNPQKLLIEPCSRAVTDNFKWDLMSAKGYDTDTENDDIPSNFDNTYYMPRSIVIEQSDLPDDRPINLPADNIIIYEMHVKGFTVHDSSGVSGPGTYSGIIEKIPYLKDLGITTVELLPVQEFDEFENVNVNPLTGEQLKNYWGYSTICFFAPKGSYSGEGPPGHQVKEFREMVKAFHDAGIEVILDVVFNHTAEGDHTGPTVSFRGLDNSVYYILEEDKSFYRNYSGCGNTVNCNHPLVRDFILDCLRYWVIEMNIDGFRFDLASILGRDSDGTILSNPPLIERIDEDPVLRNTKIIAEAWDAAGAYQLGLFPGRWAEWNGRYRDDVRRFWRGEDGTVGSFATRLTGSEDLYRSSLHGPLHSINFITCHDGFTMNDLVSYHKKHNEANGENNRDGDNHNLSMNFGIEGPPLTPFIDKMRKRQIKNLLTSLFLSKGIPMLLAGDEFRRTQRGNNNAYCQDNDISWIDWTFLETHREVHRFTRELIRFRKEQHIFRRGTFYTGTRLEGDDSAPDISWHGGDIGHPDWSPDSRAIALLINGEHSKDDAGRPDSDMYIIFNASMASCYFNIPPSPSGKEWRTAIDTSREAPKDIYEGGKEPVFNDNRYHVKKLSTVVFITQK